MTQKPKRLQKIWSWPLIRLMEHGYRTFYGMPSGKYNRITPHIYLGGQYRAKGLPWFKARQITAVVSMRMSKPKKFLKVPWLSVLHLPTLDNTAPSLAALREGVGFITHHLDKNNGNVYIHCRLGEGRGPTMAAAYLVSTGITPVEAWKAILAIRPFVNPSPSQLAQLENWYAKVQEDN